jgi:hypothetical protein
LGFGKCFPHGVGYLIKVGRMSSPTTTASNASNPLEGLSKRRQQEQHQLSGEVNYPRMTIKCTVTRASNTEPFKCPTANCQYENVYMSNLRKHAKKCVLQMPSVTSSATNTNGKLIINNFY